MAFKNITIIGGSGAIGKLIVDAFIGQSQFNVTLLTRASSSSTFPAGFAIRKTDFSLEDLTAAFKGQDVVISVVGLNVFKDQIKYIDAAVAAGVKRFLPSEFSANTQSPAVASNLFPFGEKVEVFEHLKKQESKGLTWTNLYTALLFDWGLDNGFLGFNIKERTATIWDDGNTEFTLANVDQMQKATISVLEHPAETENKNIYIASAVLSQNRILASLEKATGAKFTTGSTTSDAVVKDSKDKLANGDLSGLFALVAWTAFGNNDKDLRGNYARDETLSNDLLGLSYEDIDVTTARVVKNLA